MTEAGDLRGAGTRGRGDVSGRAPKHRHAALDQLWPRKYQSPEPPGGKDNRRGNGGGGALPAGICSFLYLINRASEK